MTPLEIERKFLIEKSTVPDEKCSEIISIVQTYLNRPESGLQRRVRSMCISGDTKYYYTEKRFLSAAVREENEREISAAEYEQLLCETDKSLEPVIKTRKILVFEGQRFEIDCYPFSDRLAVMELELQSEEQEIVFPPFITVLGEVTGNSAYSNASLAKNGHFPEE